MRLLKRRSWLRCPWRRKAWHDGHFCGWKGWFDAELVKWLNQNLNSWNPWFSEMSVIVFCLGKVILPMCPGYLPRYRTNCAIGMMNSFSIYIYINIYTYKLIDFKCMCVYYIWIYVSGIFFPRENQKNVFQFLWLIRLGHFRSPQAFQSKRWKCLEVCVALVHQVGSLFDDKFMEFFSWSSNGEQMLGSFDIMILDLQTFLVSFTRTEEVGIF